MHGETMKLGNQFLALATESPAFKTLVIFTYALPCWRMESSACLVFRMRLSLISK